MTGLGLLAAPTQAPFDLSGRVSGVRVFIFGGGLAGRWATPKDAEKVDLEPNVQDNRRLAPTRLGLTSIHEAGSQVKLSTDRVLDQLRQPRAVIFYASPPVGQSERRLRRVPLHHLY
jgi:hypothetical protein